jgi:hypothetical protein
MELYTTDPHLSFLRSGFCVNMDSIRSPIWVGWLVWTFYGPDRQGYKGGIAPLDLRDSGPTTYGWTSRPRALEPAAGVMNRPGDRARMAGVYTSLD